MEVFSVSNNSAMTTSAEKALKAIVENIRPMLPGYTQLDVMAVVSLMKKVCCCNDPEIPFWDALEMINDDELKHIITKYTKIDVVWERVKWIAPAFSEAIYDEIISNLKSEDKFGLEDIPSSISELVLRLLNLSGEEYFLHLGSHSGMTLDKVSRIYPEVQPFGIEADLSGFNISKLRMGMLHKNEFPGVELPQGILQEIEQKAIIINDSIVNAEEHFGKWFDKAFCSGPWGFKVKTYLNDMRISSRVKDKRYQLKGGLSAEWLYSLIMLDLLKENGTAIGLFPAACLFTNIDKETREELLRKRKIQAVITLPPKMFTYTSVNLVMVVFKNNDSYISGVRMIDASKLCVNQRRQNIFTREHIEKILLAMEEDSEYSKLIPFESLQENNFILSPERYLVVHDDDDGEPLGDLVTFGRSVMLKASDLDLLDTQDDTGKFYMRLSEIKDGLINENLPRLTHIEEKDKKSILEDSDIILSRNGAPFKIAMYHSKENEEVLPIGNLYILKAKKDLINPVYLKAYLESTKGLAKLASCLTGITIQIISLESLKKIRIPLPSLEEQNRIAKKYLAILDELECLRTKTEHIRDQLKNILEDEGNLES